VFTAVGSQTPSYTSYDATCPPAGPPAYSVWTACDMEYKDAKA